MSASERLALEMQRQQERSDRGLSGAGRRNITIGCVLLFGGIAATVVTYAGASAMHGGSYYVFYGAMLAGIIEIFRGLGQTGPRPR